VTLKVIGAGFGRTGTASLQRALEILDLGPCYHMFDVRRQPWRAQAWRRATRNQRADWDAIFDGYQSTVDWPGCLFFEELAAEYPEALVILTVRDGPSWHQSCLRTIHAIAGALPPLLNLIPIARQIRRMLFEVIWDGTFDGRFTDTAHAIATFEAHNQRVRDTISPERLLELEIGEGWQPLCEFLSVPIPEQPFPRLNEGRELEALAATIRWRSRVVYGALLVAGLAGLARLLQVTLTG
jgi:hypothetical protein